MEYNVPALTAALLFTGATWVSAQPESSGDQQCPDVLEAKVRPRGANTFDFDVTISSPYDTADRYADAFRVLGPDGTVYGERILLHDHASEQPFTRDLHGVTIPTGITSVIVQGRDKKYGYGGKTIEVTLPGR
jgi:hypothetical protein